MTTADALAFLIERAGYVRRRAHRREAEGLPTRREVEEVDALEHAIGTISELAPSAAEIARSRVAMRERGRGSARPAETLSEALCRILGCEPRQIIDRVAELAGRGKGAP